MAEKYINLSEGQRTCIEILAINTCVFIAWQIPPLRAGCTRFLLHNPLSTRSFSLLGSVFSHKVCPAIPPPWNSLTTSPARSRSRISPSIPSPCTRSRLQPPPGSTAEVRASNSLEAPLATSFSRSSSQVRPPGFPPNLRSELTHHLPAGLCSSIVSHLWSVRVLLPRMLRSAGTAVASPAILPSLGASGACLARSCRPLR